MTDRTIELSRRKILGSVGAIGLAGAASGLGTSALFSDSESFENNTFTAGELDLRVDWEEHYWRDQTLPDGMDVTLVGDSAEVGDGQVGLPDPQTPMLAVDDEDLAGFMDATSIEAYPDSDNDGIQDDLSLYDACEHFAQLDRDLDPANGYPVAGTDRVARRTANDDTLDGDAPEPLVNLDDVKPGDFGELTLSFHLCDNPGYVWLHGDPVSADEGGHTEPEGNADGEEGTSAEMETGADVLDSQVELLDAVETLVWYDEDGDNVFDPGGEEEDVDLLIVFDQSESMNSGPDSGNNDANPGKLDEAVSGAKTLVDSVGSATNQGLVCFSDVDATGVKQPLGSPESDIKQDLDDLDGPDDPTNPLIDDNQSGVTSDGSQSPQTDSDGDGQDDDNLILDTDLEGGISSAHDELTGPNGRPGARKIMVVLSDGQPWPTGQDVTGAADDAKADDVEIFTIAYGSGADEALMESVASDPKDTHAFVGDEADIGAIFGQIGETIVGEKVIFRGSLRSLLTAVSSGDGIPLDGDRSTFFDELSDPEDADAREEFVNSTNNFVGVTWWLPRGVGNEVQSDSVGFDLGFYTEQARNNDGSGQTDSAST